LLFGKFMELCYLCVVMKQKIAFFFAAWLFLGSLFPQTDLEEACKVPFLLLHHQTEHAELSFLDYLQLHYGEDANQNCPVHDSLPMHAHTHSLTSILFVHFDFSYNLPLPAVVHFSEPFNGFWQDLYQFQPDNTLFSPPKFV